MEQHFSLSWREFQGNLSLGCARLLGSGEFADVTLATEGQLLQAHRLVLSICSPYFQRMFLANPCQHPIVVLKDISYRAMKSLLQFMYNGEVSVRQEDLTTFISTAETLEIKGLTTKISNNNTDTRKSEETHVNNSTTNNGDDNVNNVLVNDIDDLNVSTAKQMEMLNQLNKLTSLKRKCDSFLQNNCGGDNAENAEKRTKFREKQILNRHKITHNHQKKLSSILSPLDKQQNSIHKNDTDHLANDLSSDHNSEESKTCNDERDLRMSVNSQESSSLHDNDDLINDKEQTSIKKEKTDDESDCTITESPVRTEIISVRNDLTEAHPTRTSPRIDQQDGGFNVKPERSSSRLAPWPGSLQNAKSVPFSEHKIVTIPQKEDGKKKYPQKSCRYCWRAGRRRDTRFMCEQCCVPLCKMTCFEQHQLTSDLFLMKNEGNTSFNQ